MENDGVLPLCVMAIFGIVMFAFCVITIVDVVKSDSKTDKQKLLWVLLILFTGIIGALLYFALGRDNRNTGDK